MESQATPGFWRRYKKAPEAMRVAAREAYILFRSNPNDPRLHFKNLKGNLWSARVFETGWRALGLREGECITWVFLGDHDDYVTAIKAL